MFLRKLRLEVREGRLEGGVGLRGDEGRGIGGVSDKTVKQGLVFLLQVVDRLLPEIKPLFFWIISELKDAGVGGYMTTSGDFTLEIKKLLFELVDAIKEGLVLRMRSGKRFVVVEQVEQGGFVGLLCLVASDEVFEEIDFALGKVCLGVLFSPGVLLMVKVLGEFLDVGLCRSELGLELGMLVLKGMQGGKGGAVLVKKVSVLEAEGDKGLVVGCRGRGRRRKGRRGNLKLSKLVAQRVSVGGLGLEGANLFAQDLCSLVGRTERDELGREIGVVGLEFADMLGELPELGCENGVVVRVIGEAGLLVFKLILEAVDVRETVGSERLGLFEGGLEGGVAVGESGGGGFFRV